MPDPLSGYEDLASTPGAVGDAVRQKLDYPALTTETPSDTAARQMRDVQQAAKYQRIRGADLAKRDIPSFTDETGAVQPVTDEAGAPLTQLDKKHGIAWDSAGNPKKLVYDSLGGPPKTVDPFAGLAPETDPKTGDQYLKPPGLPWQHVGRDDKIAGELRQKEIDKALRETSTTLGRKLSLDEHEATKGSVELKHRSQALAGLVPPLAMPENADADPETAQKLINQHFDDRLKSEAADPGAFTSFFGAKPDLEARAKIEQERTKALQAASEFHSLKDRVSQAKTRAETERAAAQSIADARLQSSLAKLDASAPAYIAGQDGSVTFQPIRAYDATVQAARDGAFGRPVAPEELAAAQQTQVEARKQASAESAVAEGVGSSKLYAINKGGQIQFDTSRPFDAHQQAVADGHLPPPSDEQEHLLWSAQQFEQAKLGNKPYGIGDGDTLKIDEQRPFDSLNAAVGDGVMKVPPDEVFKAAEEKQKLIEQAGSNPKIKAALGGLGRGAAFMAAAPLGAGAGAELGAELGAAGFVSGPGGFITVGGLSAAGSIIGGLASGTVGAMTYGKLLETIGHYNDTINSFVASQKIHPGYAMAGELATFGAGLPRAAMKAIGGGIEGLADSAAAASKAPGSTADMMRASINVAQKAGQPIEQDIAARAARYLDAIGKSYQGSGGGLRATIENFSKQADIIKEGGGTAADVAKRTARDVLTSAGAMVAIDTAIKEGSKALGISDEGQTWAGAGVAALLGAFAAGHGITFRDYTPQQVAEIALNGRAHFKTGVGTGFEIPPEKLAELGIEGAEAQRVARPLTPEEHEIFEAFKDKIADLDGKGIKLDPAKIVLEAQQALRGGRSIGVRSVKIEGEAGGEPTTAGTAGLPSGGAPEDPASPAPSAPASTPSTGKTKAPPQTAAPAAEAPDTTGSAQAVGASGETTPKPALASTFPAGTVIAHGDDEIHIGHEGKALTWQGVRGGQIVATGQAASTRAATQAGKAALDAIPNGDGSIKPNEISGVIGGIGKGMGESLNASLWKAVEEGRTDEAGTPSAILQMAKRVRDAGGLKTKDDGVDFLRRAGAVKTKHFGKPEYQAELQKFVADEIGKVSNAGQPSVAPGGSTGAAPAPSSIDQAAHQAATSPANDHPEPTPAQIEVGNYRKGHIKVGGLDISVENPAGSERKGVNKAGKPWSVEMKSHYGYIKGTVGRDKDHVDAFVLPGTPDSYAGPVFVVNQVDPSTGRFDEHKAVIGAPTMAAARVAYLDNYQNGWKGTGSIGELTMDQFKDWLKNGDQKKPVEGAPTPAATPTKAPTSPSKPASTPSEPKFTGHEAKAIAENLIAESKHPIKIGPTKNESGFQFNTETGEISIEPAKAAKTIKTVLENDKKAGLPASTPEKEMATLIRHEVWHTGQKKLADEAGKSLEQFYNDVPDDRFPKDMDEWGRKFRTDWDKMKRWQQKAEFTAGVAQGEYDGEIPKSLIEHIKAVIEYLKGVAKNGSEWLKAHVAELEKRVNGAKEEAPVAEPKPPKAEKPVKAEAPAPAPPTPLPIKRPPSFPADKPARMALIERWLNSLSASELYDKLKETGAMTKAAEKIWKAAREDRGESGRDFGMEWQEEAGEALEKWARSGTKEPTPEQPKAESLEPAKKLDAAQQAIKDALGDLLDADAPKAEYTTPIPKEKREAVNKLAADLIDAHGVDTPDKLAAKLAGIGPKAQAFSQAIWFKMKSESAVGPAEPDWASVYQGLQPGGEGGGDTVSAPTEPAEQIRQIAARQEERKAAERMAKAPDTSPAKARELDAAEQPPNSKPPSMGPTAAPDEPSAEGTGDAEMPKSETSSEKPKDSQPAAEKWRDHIRDLQQNFERTTPAKGSEAREFLDKRYKEINDEMKAVAARAQEFHDKAKRARDYQKERQHKDRAYQIERDELRPLEQQQKALKLGEAINEDRVQNARNPFTVLDALERLGKQKGVNTHSSKIEMAKEALNARGITGEEADSIASEMASFTAWREGDTLSDMVDFQLRKRGEKERKTMWGALANEAFKEPSTLQNPTMRHLMAKVENAADTGDGFDEALTEARKFYEQSKDKRVADDQKAAAEKKKQQAETSKGAKEILEGKVMPSKNGLTEKQAELSKRGIEMDLRNRLISRDSLPQGPIMLQPAQTPKRKPNADPLTTLADVVSQDSTRYVLNGVHIASLKGQKVAVATDGRRLVVIPYKGDLAEGGTYATGPHFRGDKRGQEIEGNFPKWQSVIPDVAGVKKRPVTEEMAGRALQAVFATRLIDGTGYVPLVLTNGEGRPIGVNGRLFWEEVDALRKAGFNEITIAARGPDDPIVLQTKDPNAFAVLMPIRMDGKPLKMDSIEIPHFPAEPQDKAAKKPAKLGALDAAAPRAVASKAPSTDFEDIQNERQKRGDDIVAREAGLTPANVRDFMEGTNKTGINPYGFGHDGLTMEIQRRRQEGVSSAASPAPVPVKTPEPAKDSTSEDFTPEFYEAEKQKYQVFDPRKTPAPKPVTPTLQERLAIKFAYDEEVLRRGFPAVAIADVMEGAGFGPHEMERGRGIMNELYRKGEVVLSLGDWSIVNDRERAWTVPLHGQNYLQVRFLPAGGGKNTLDAAPVKAFVDEDMKPVLETAKQSLAEVLGVIPKILNPISRVEPVGGDAAMRYKGIQDERAFIVEKTFQAAEKMFARMQRPDQVDFIDRIKRGEKQPNAALQGVADMMNEIDAGNWQRIHDAQIALGQKEEQTIKWKQDHYRVMWKTIPGSMEEKLNAGAFGRGPLSGSKSFLKHATLADMSEGLAMGGVPYSFNPVTMAKRAWADQWKLEAALGMFKWMKDNSFVVFAKGTFPKLPEGYQWVEDPLFTRYFPAASGEGLVTLGRYAVETNMARLLKNWLSRDLIREKATFRGLMWMKNATTAAELGLSPFHFMFETFEMMGGSIGLGLQKIFNRGFLHGDAKALADGLKDMIGSPVSPKTTWTLGKNAERLLTEQGFASTDAGKKFLKQFPNASHILHLAFLGGAKLDSPEWKIGTLQTFVENLNQNNWIGATLRALPAANEAIMKPLFEWYIPRLKLGLFMREMSNALVENSNRLASRQVSEETLARQVWGFVEDRFGETNFDNLFWNRTFKAAAQLMFRSVTWKMGSIRAIGGAAMGQGQEFINAVRDKRAPQLHRNFAWFLGLCVVTAALSTILMRVFAGKSPESLKDLVYPRIDPKDDHVRVGLPTYVKDLVHLHHSPKQFITSSLSGWIGRVHDLWVNQDFYGTKLRNEDDPILTQAMDVAKYGSQALLPFTVRGYQNLSDQDVNGVRKALAMLAFNPAPKHVTQSAAEQQAKEYRHEMMPIGGRTKEQSEKGRALSFATTQMRKGEPVSGVTLNRQLTLQDMQTVTKRAALTPLQVDVKSLSLDRAEKVYAAASPKEKAQLAQIMADKRANAAKKNGATFSSF